jgi:RNA polymerase sigma-70 factor (ECF subfamily)
MREISHWLTLSGRGNAEAFQQLYQRTSPQLYRVCLQLLDDPDKAEKVLAAGFVQVWRRSRHYDPQRDAAMPWLLRTFQRAARK